MPKNIMSKLRARGLFLSLLCLFISIKTNLAYGWAREHSYITKAAIETLSPEERAYLGEEAELLSSLYCGFPDTNQPRLEPWRTEWHIVYYCLGRYGDHAPPAAYEASKTFFKRAMEEIYAGKFIDAIRFLGAGIHYVEDCGSMPHVPSIHCRIGNIVDPNLIDIKEYKPKLLGKTVEEAADNVEKRVRELVKFTEEKALPVRAILEQKKPEGYPIIVEMCNETARAVADILHTFIRLSPPKKTLPETFNPTGVNLIKNSSFELPREKLPSRTYPPPYFPPNPIKNIPRGWVRSWVRKPGKLEEKVGKGDWDSSVAHTGKYSIKLVSTPKWGTEWRQIWPNAIRVKPGEKYRCSGWIKTENATGESYLCVYFYQYTKLRFLNNEPIYSVKSKTVSGTTDWQELSFEFTVPEGVDIMRLSCRSDDNKGAVWFDDVELILISLSPVKSKAGAEAKERTK